MSQFPNVVIVMSRCSRTKQGFGIRFEEKSQGRWMADWAFSINEALARKEGYSSNEIKGTFDFDNTYPGCPYCHAMSFFQCTCGKIACWNEAPLPCTVSCPWCESKIVLAVPITSIAVGEDR